MHVNLIDLPVIALEGLATHMTGDMCQCMVTSHHSLSAVLPKAEVAMSTFAGALPSGFGRQTNRMQERKEEIVWNIFILLQFGTVLQLECCLFEFNWTSPGMLDGLLSRDVSKVMSLLGFLVVVLLLVIRRQVGIGLHGLDCIDHGRGMSKVLNIAERLRSRINPGYLVEVRGDGKSVSPGVMSEWREHREPNF